MPKKKTKTLLQGGGAPSLALPSAPPLLPLNGAAMIQNRPRQQPSPSRTASASPPPSRQRQQSRAEAEATTAAVLAEADDYMQTYHKQIEVLVGKRAPDDDDELHKMWVRKREHKAMMESAFSKLDTLVKNHEQHMLDLDLKQNNLVAQIKLGQLGSRPGGADHSARSEETEKAIQAANEDARQLLSELSQLEKGDMVRAKELDKVFNYLLTYLGDAPKQREKLSHIEAVMAEDGKKKFDMTIVMKNAIAQLQYDHAELQRNAAEDMDKFRVMSQRAYAADLQISSAQEALNHAKSDLARKEREHAEEVSRLVEKMSQSEVHHELQLAGVIGDMEKVKEKLTASTTENVAMRARLVDAAQWEDRCLTIEAETAVLSKANTQLKAELQAVKTELEAEKLARETLIKTSAEWEQTLRDRLEAKEQEMEAMKVRLDEMKRSRLMAAAAANQAASELARRRAAAVAASASSPSSLDALADIQTAQQLVFETNQAAESKWKAEAERAQIAEDEVERLMMLIVEGNRRSRGTFVATELGGRESTSGVNFGNFAVAHVATQTAMRALRDQSVGTPSSWAIAIGAVQAPSNVDVGTEMEGVNDEYASKWGLGGGSLTLPRPTGGGKPSGPARRKGSTTSTAGVGGATAAVAGGAAEGGLLSLPTDNNLYTAGTVDSNAGEEAATVVFEARRTVMAMYKEVEMMIANYEAAVRKQTKKEMQHREVLQGLLGQLERVEQFHETEMKRMVEQLQWAASANTRLRYWLQEAQKVAPHMMVIGHSNPHAATTGGGQLRGVSQQLQQHQQQPPQAQQQHGGVWEHDHRRQGNGSALNSPGTATGASLPSPRLGVPQSHQLQQHQGVMPRRATYAAAPSPGTTISSGVNPFEPQPRPHELAMLPTPLDLAASVVEQPGSIHATYDEVGLRLPQNFAEIVSAASSLENHQRKSTTAASRSVHSTSAHSAVRGGRTTEPTSTDASGGADSGAGDAGDVGDKSGSDQESGGGEVVMEDKNWNNIVFPILTMVAQVADSVTCPPRKGAFADHLRRTCGFGANSQSNLVQHRIQMWYTNALEAFDDRFQRRRARIERQRLLEQLQQQQDKERVGGDDGSSGSVSDRRSGSRSVSPRQLSVPISDLQLLEVPAQHSREDDTMAPTVSLPTVRRLSGPGDVLFTRENSLDHQRTGPAGRSRTTKFQIRVFRAMCARAFSAWVEAVEAVRLPFNYIETVDNMITHLGQAEQEEEEALNLAQGMRDAVEYCRRQFIGAVDGYELRIRPSRNRSSAVGGGGGGGGTGISTRQVIPPTSGGGGGWGSQLMMKQSSSNNVSAVGEGGTAGTTAAGGGGSVAGSEAEEGDPRILDLTKKIERLEQDMDTHAQHFKARERSHMHDRQDLQKQLQEMRAEKQGALEVAASLRNEMDYLAQQLADAYEDVQEGQFGCALLQGIIYNQQTRMDVEHASLRRMLFEARAEAIQKSQREKALELEVEDAVNALAAKVASGRRKPVAPAEKPLPPPTSHRPESPTVSPGSRIPFMPLSVGTLAVSHGTHSPMPKVSIREYAAPGTQEELQELVNRAETLITTLISEDIRCQGDLRKLSQRLQLAVEGGEESRQPLLRATVAMTEMQTDLSIPLVEAGQPLDLQLLSAYVHTSTQPEKHGSSMDKFRKLEAENAVLRKMEEHFKKHLTELKRMVIDSRRERDSAKKDVEHLMAELKKNQDHSIVLANALMLPKRKRSQHHRQISRYRTGPISRPDTAETIDSSETGGSGLSDAALAIARAVARGTGGGKVPSRGDSRESVSSSASTSQSRPGTSGMAVTVGAGAGGLGDRFSETDTTTAIPEDGSPRRAAAQKFLHRNRTNNSAGIWQHINFPSETEEEGEVWNPAVVVPTLVGRHFEESEVLQSLAPEIPLTEWIILVEKAPTMQLPANVEMAMLEATTASLRFALHAREQVALQLEQALQHAKELEDEADRLQSLVKSLATMPVVPSAPPSSRINGGQRLRIHIPGHDSDEEDPPLAVPENSSGGPSVGTGFRAASPSKGMNSEWSGYASRRNSSSSPPSQGSVAAAFALANVAKGSTVPVSPAIMREVGLHTAIARHRSASIGGASAESLKPVYDNISKLEDQIIKLHSDIEQLREDLDDRDTAIEALKEERDKTKLEAQRANQLVVKYKKISGEAQAAAQRAVKQKERAEVDCRDLIFRAHEARDLALQRDHESRLKNVLFASEIQTLQNRCEGLEQRAAETMANMRESASLQLRELSKALRAAEDVANVAIAVARVAHKHLLALGVSTANAPTPVLTSSFRSLAPVADALNLDSSKLAHVIYNEQSKKQQLQLQGKHSILTLDPLIAKNSEGSVGNKKQNGRAEEEVANEKGNKVGTDENRIASALLLLRSSASSAASNASDSSSDNTGSTAQFNCDPFNGSLWEREEATVGAMLIEAPLRPLRIPIGDAESGMHNAIIPTNPIDPAHKKRTQKRLAKEFGDLADELPAAVIGSVPLPKLPSSQPPASAGMVEPPGKAVIRPAQPSPRTVSIAQIHAEFAGITPRCSKLPLPPSFAAAAATITTPLSTTAEEPEQLLEKKPIESKKDILMAEERPAVLHAAAVRAGKSGFGGAGPIRGWTPMSPTASQQTKATQDMKKKKKSNNPA